MPRRSISYAFNTRLVALATIAWILLASVAQAQGPDPLLLSEKPGWVTVEAHDANYFKRARYTPLERDDRPMDVTHYDISLQVTDVMDSLYGDVTVHLTAMEDLDTVELDLFTGSMLVEELWVNDSLNSFEHVDDRIVVPLPSLLIEGSSITVRVRYRGLPESYGFKGYEVSQFRRGTFEGENVIQTLSEPKTARSWWPCHDTPYDAATISAKILAPELMTVVVPGTDRSRITEALLPMGWRETSIEMPTPIPAYLFSLAISEYDYWTDNATVTDFATGNAVEMPLEFYIARSQPAGAVDWLGDSYFAWGTTAPMIEYFDQAFGPYPFSDLRYGMAMFVWGGAMEHATCSSMGQNLVSGAQSGLTGGPLYENIVAHEMAHQWYGDCVRVERWGEIWLNEGFASYSEVIWYEEAYGHEIAQTFRQNRFWDFIDSFTYPMVDPPVADLFGIVVYRKGASVLHMLREVFEERYPGQGLDKLLEAMRNYVTDPKLRFEPVKSEDFQRHAEMVYGAAESGMDWFFEPWLYWDEVCTLDTRWSQDEGQLTLSMRQDPRRSFRLPVPVRVYTTTGDSLQQWVWTDSPNTIVTIPVGGEVDRVVIDPDRDFLIHVQTQSASESSVIFGSGFANPYIASAGGLFTLPAHATRTTRLEAEVYDARGRRVRGLYSQVVAPGPVDLHWDGTDKSGRRVASGLYFIRARADDIATTQKVILVR